MAEINQEQEVSRTCIDAINAGLLNLMFTAFIVTVMPSMILLMKLYLPCGAVNVCHPPPAVPPPSFRPISHVSIVIFTSSKLYYKTIKKI